MKIMRVMTTTVLLLCSTITLAQNTFYTKGLKVEECYDEEQVLFNELSENDSYLATIKIIDMFSRVNFYSYDYNVTFDVDSTSVEKEGYTLYCLDQTGATVIVRVDLDKMVIVVWFYGRNGNVIKEIFKINIIK
jgi:hypothetical protein